jgi:hypothetical protein
MVRIISRVEFSDNGSQGFEINYDPQLTVGDYIDLFERQTRELNNENRVKIFSLHITEHDEEGNEIIDED